MTSRPGLCPYVDCIIHTEIGKIKILNKEILESGPQSQGLPSRICLLVDLKRKNNVPFIHMGKEIVK